LRVQAGAEGAPFARKHDGAYAASCFELFSGRHECAEHRIVEGVHLVGTFQPHVGDAVVQINADAIFHE
jgi:hypothetical protein